MSKKEEDELFSDLASTLREHEFHFGETPKRKKAIAQIRFDGLPEPEEDITKIATRIEQPKPKKRGIIRYRKAESQPIKETIFLLISSLFRLLLILLIIIGLFNIGSFLIGVKF